MKTIRTLHAFGSKGTLGTLYPSRPNDSSILLSSDCILHRTRNDFTKRK